MEITPLIVSLITTFGTALSVAAMFYGQINEFKQSTKERLNEMDAAIKRLEEETATTQGAHKLFMETMTEVKKQTNKIWEKLEKMDDELKDIYKRKDK